MDLNYLFYRQQVEHSRAKSGANEPARRAHEELARKYEERIEALTPEEYHFPMGESAPEAVG
ncbi:hypothetical protein LZ518_11215 [Sphingomonas sp. RB56-2]|uniref:Uncharacterized protein n=1 Tax=Sphingomonas brevis TaxID=2908206 RepID=A0ABT0SC86_9SPHN|nr:hypothetical protein [Sphingomonas brevis]MCL6741695.1 hypothetical protein [Sphingomonas brevis]